jgi:hypothetical protein
MQKVAHPALDAIKIEKALPDDGKTCKFKQ